MQDNREKILKLNFFKSRQGDIISHLKSGKLALISKEYRGDLKIQANETWEVKIVVSTAKCIIIEPIKLLYTEEQNLIFWANKPKKENKKEDAVYQAGLEDFRDIHDIK